RAAATRSRLSPAVAFRFGLAAVVSCADSETAATANESARTREMIMLLPDGAPDDEGDRQEERGDEDRDGDVAALQLRGKIDLGREPVDDAIAHVHQNDAEGGVHEVQAENGQLHDDSSVTGGVEVSLKNDAAVASEVSPSEWNSRAAV